MKKNEKKKFIKKFYSSIKYSIFFAFKKNELFRLYIDYQKLNNIIIKNKYLLFKLNELQNKIIEIKFYTKLDLRETYNLIRIKTKKMKNYFSFTI